MTVLGGKSGKNTPNTAFFGALCANISTFLLIYSKISENKMSFEIHVTTIATGKIVEFFRPLSFFGLEFFSKMFKKAWIKFRNF